MLTLHTWRGLEYLCFHFGEVLLFGLLNFPWYSCLWSLQLRLYLTGGSKISRRIFNSSSRMETHGARGSPGYYLAGCIGAPTWCWGASLYTSPHASGAGWSAIILGPHLRALLFLSDNSRVKSQRKATGVLNHPGHPVFSQIGLRSTLTAALLFRNRNLRRVLFSVCDSPLQGVVRLLPFFRSTRHGRGWSTPSYRQCSPSPVAYIRVLLFVFEAESAFSEFARPF